MTEGKDNPEDSAAPLIEHLTELRQRLIYSVSAFTVAMLACFTVCQDDHKNQMHTYL